MRNAGTEGRVAGKVRAVAVLLAAAATLAACSDSATLTERKW